MANQTAKEFMTQIAEACICKGSGSYMVYPTCKFCQDSTHDHECPGEVEMKCEDKRCLLARAALATSGDLHAGAPHGYKCSDCAIDKEPCLNCYAAAWRKRHPNVVRTCGVYPGLGTCDPGNEFHSDRPHGPDSLHTQSARCVNWRPRQARPSLPEGVHYDDCVIVGCQKMHTVRAPTKVIVAVFESNLTESKVFMSVEAYSTWYLKTCGFDEDLRLACEKLTAGGDFADASSWVGWVEATL